MSAAPCIGCGRTARPVVLELHGLAAVDAGVDQIDGPPVCDRCMAESERELDGLRAEYRRLVLRGHATHAGRMMVRRVRRYFRNGTLRPLKGRAVA